MAIMMVYDRTGSVFLDLTRLPDMALGQLLADVQEEYRRRSAGEPAPKEQAMYRVDMWSKPR